MSINKISKFPRKPIVMKEPNGMSYEEKLKIIDDELGAFYRLANNIIYGT